jgi:catechol 2,3-dioxygenase-like lactoylglutathione lyase family enzyme
MFADIQIDRIDHIVLTVRDLATSRDFYSRVLGMRLLEEPGRPLALHFGNQKIHLHQAGKEFDPKARVPTPGSGDLCLIATTPVAEVVARLETEGIAIEVGPVERTGATGPIRSVYFRDPDGNLVEVSNYL